MKNKQTRPREGPPFVFTFIWLFYLAFPLHTMLQQPIGEMVVDSILILVFAASYIISFRYHKGRFGLIIVMLLIVAVFCIRYHENFLYMAFYPSPVIGTLRSTRRMLLAMGAMLLLFGSISLHYELYSDSDQMLSLLPAIMVMLLMPVAMRYGWRSRELRGKLTLANEEIARLSKNEERQRISRDLHDTLGHTLSLITLKSELAEKLIVKNPERAVKEVRDIQDTSRAALNQVRELVSGMNTVTIQDEVDHAKQILAAAGIVLETKGDFDTHVESTIIDNILGMCLREAVTNVVKHSQARMCTIERAEEPGRILLSVTDNGKGVVNHEGNPAVGCNGIKGMKERLKLVEGELLFEPDGGRVGTRLTFIVPLVAKSIVKGGAEE
ncbi:sensor histidine kinase [Paenibacillus mendelii]|uniref:histidine kinase n=1 Tax=Paenibacillus mendelii TaxID=206163 RepID=A0ABV6JD20_9BACL|nr:sensor histidine kinase [Paenibacillus mendelii]MCQ6562446.1 sensor histidine kinase [Paenibacillus mendelii]